MKATPKACDAPDCDRPARTRNYAWCTLHDRRVRVYGSVDLPPERVRHKNEGHMCAATDCPEPAKSKGYCGLHWERIRRHGSPDVVIPAVARQVVYFVLASNSRKVKIGLTANPELRLATMQTGCPEPLELLGVVAGGRRLETRLHRELADDCSHGEWFHCTENVMSRVAHLLGGVPVGRTA